MNTSFSFIDWFEILIFFGLFLAIAPSLGKYIGRVLDGSIRIPAFFARIEKSAYYIARIDPAEEMTPLEYVLSLIVFALFSALFLFAVLVGQEHLPLNPQAFPGLSWDQALNTTISYVTGTHWLPYPPETYLSYASHLAGGTLQSFFSGAIGLSVLAALARGFSRNKESTLGNFWVDFVRSILYIFLPLASILSVFLIIQGVLQSFDPYVAATTLEGNQQMIPQGPAATEIAISQLSGGGGGFFNVGRAHPLENPSALSNFFECIAMLIIPGAIPFAFATMVKSKGEGLLTFSVMFFLWIVGLALSLWSDHQFLENLKIDALIEGKEARIGIANSATWLSIASATGNGSLNSTLSSATPLTQSVAFFNLLSGNVIFGPPGLGMCSMFLFIGLTVFLAGLLAGRTPEFLGKKLEWREMRWIALGIAIPNILILLTSAFLMGRFSGGHKPEEFSSLVFMVTSVFRLNGANLGMVNVATPFYNIVTAFAMGIGWLFSIIPVMAIAGNMALKRIYPESTLELAILNRRLALLLICLIAAFVFVVFFPLLLMGPLANDLILFERVG